MGFETFRVELRGGSATHAQAAGAVSLHPHARPDPDAIRSRGSAYFTIEDGTHVMEVEVASPPVRVSCRFTLCHPPTVDAALLGFVRDLQNRLGMEAGICDDTRPEQSRWFPATRFGEFADIVHGHITARRAEWIANFGPTLLCATTAEVYAQIILPNCTPVAG